MESHPLYQRPQNDQGRDNRTDDWTKSAIVDFLDERYDNPLGDFGANNYEELIQKIDNLGLEYDERSDWREDQVPDLGDREFDYSITSFLAKPEDVEGPGSDDSVSPEVRFFDENGDLQVEYENNRAL